MFGIFSKKKKEELNKGLDQSKKSILSRIGRSIVGKSKVDQNMLDDIEEVLIESDVGVETTLKIIENLEQFVKEERFVDSEELNKLIVKSAEKILSQNHSEGNKYDFELEGAPNPYVVMVVGVNGVGKTTTIGKLAHAYKKVGKNVILGAADTFRAAAVEQLKIWGDRYSGSLFVGACAFLF